MSITLQSIGEQGLLKIIQRFCPADVVGDDGAILALQPDKSLVVTTDVLVDGIHFSDRTTPPHSVGWRSVAANLSDLAAMGALPIGITVGLSLPGETEVAWVEALYQGMGDCLAQFGGVIVGGDLVRSTVKTLAITAFGQVEPNRVMARSTAQVGDVILVTGYHGSSRAGLQLLLQPESDLGLSEDHRRALIQAHQYPIPQLSIPAQLTSPAAGMDSSDGLADAVLQICRSSQVGAVLDRSSISIHPGLICYNPEQMVNWALYGGEDFELVLCLPESRARELLKTLPEGAAIVGRITAGSIVYLLDPSGELEVLSLDRGFQHFQ